MKRALLTVTVLAAACGSDRLRRNAEAIEVVSGEPSVDQQLPGVSYGADGGVVIGGAAPYQVDTFIQQAISKVDILWIIDNSPSMQPKQDRVKANFASFMKFLTDQSIDYHLGVVSTDTYSSLESGKLQNAAALIKPWIDQQSAGGNASAAFVTNASLGTSGSGDEKGLLAGMLALTAPLETRGNPKAANCTSTECFLRTDAQLYTIVVSDEEDNSCSPVRPLGAVGGEEGCDDAQATLNGFGATDYWSRFYTGIKGPGGVSRLAAISAVDSTFQTCRDVFAGFCNGNPYNVESTCNSSSPNCTQFGNLSLPCCQALSQCAKAVGEKAQWCEVHQSSASPFYTISGTTVSGGDLVGFPGCVARDTLGKVEFTAHHAPRYATVARATGGIATSICDQDYTPALEKLGLQASGQRSDFPLSRAPVEGSVAVAVTLNGSAAITGPWRYVKCEGASIANSIHFDKPLPPPGAKVSVSYDVNVRGVTCP